MSEVEPPARDAPPAFEAPHPNGAVVSNSAASSPHRRFRLPRGVLIALLVAFVGVWVFAIIYSVTVTTRSPERLDDRAAAQVEQACRRTQDQLKALGPLPATATGAQRVSRIRAENAQFERLVADFATVKPTKSTPAAALTGWTSDWNKVVAARENYATDLDTKHRAKLIIPATAGIKPITDKMDDFVREQHHRIDSCFTDALQLETVEGQRTYAHVPD